MASSTTISLLHATYRSSADPVSIRELWLDRASQPHLVEHIFAMDADDDDALLATSGLPRVVGPTGSNEVSAVRNWNAAAAIADGDLLFVVADDLVPPQGWDAMLRRIVGRLDPARVAYAVKVADSTLAGDRLLRHPVISRRFYARLGLFDPDYRGVYCDHDITTRAFWRAVILDGRALALEHLHPTQHSSIEPSASHRKMNTETEYLHGLAVYLARWSWRHRWARKRSVPAALARTAPAIGVSLVARALRAWETGMYVPRRLRTEVLRRV